MAPLKKTNIITILELLEINRLMEAFQAENAEIRLVGGAVRDALLGLEVADIDLATPEQPDRIWQILQNQNIKAVATGIDHGTISAVINQKTYEITSLRRDIETDGRRAKIAYTDDWQEDAKRRDFTINAFYVDAEGTIYDYFDGQSDLKARHVRFIGQPEERIREDYLRILRFFRFSARFSEEIDEEGLQACIKLKDGLKKLSAERIRDELLKTAIAERSGYITSFIKKYDILTPLEINLIPKKNIESICKDKVFQKIKNPILRFCCLVEKSDLIDLPTKLKLSNEDKKTCLFLVNQAAQIDLSQNLDKLTYLYRKKDLRSAYYWQSLRMGKELSTGFVKKMMKTRPPDFPVKGQDVLKAGIRPGPKMGKLLKEVENWWLEEDCKPTRRDLQAKLEELAQNYK